MFHVFTTSLCLFDSTSKIFPFLTSYPLYPICSVPIVALPSHHPCRKVIIHSVLVLSINLLDYHVRTNARFIYMYIMKQQNTSVIITLLQLNCQIIKLVSSGGKTADGIRNFLIYSVVHVKKKYLKGLIPLTYMTQTARNILSAHSSEYLFTHFLRDFFQVCSPTV